MTEHTSDASRRQRPLWHRLLIWSIRILIVLVVLGAAAYALANYWAAKALSAEIARIRAAGQPLTFADLEKMSPKVDEARDSGPYYAAALALVHSVDRSEPPGYDEAIRTGQVTSAILDEAQRRLEPNRLALAMLDRGSALSDCGYDMELKYGISIVLPRFSKWRMLARAASLRTRLLAFEGQPDQAVESAVASLRMLRVFDRSPILVAYLVKVGCTALFCEDVAAILNHARPSAQSLDALETALGHLEQSIDLRSMFLAERVYYLEISRDIVGSDRGWPSAAIVDANRERNAPALPGQLPGGLALRIMVARSLPVYGRFIDAAAKGWPATIDAANALAAEPRSRWEIFSRLVAPSFARSTTTTARCLAQLRSARVALRIERYRLANGRLPDDLNQLPRAANLPDDPFTGKPLIYRKIADGYCVYSLGDEHRDDGGKNLNQRGPNRGIQVRSAATRPASE